MESLKDVCSRLRSEIEAMKQQVLPCKDIATTGEGKANVMLTYRHLEDARMRLGKVLQAEDGGVSIYDKAKGE